MKPVYKLSGISLWLFLLIPGVFGAGEVAGQVPKQSSANAVVSDRATLAESAGYWIFLDGKPNAPPAESK